MADEPDNRVLAHLRHMRGVLDRVAEDVAGLKDRVGGLERSVAQIHVTLAEHSIRMDRIEHRPTRMETRLDLVEV